VVELEKHGGSTGAAGTFLRQDPEPRSPWVVVENTWFLTVSTPAPMLVRAHLEEDHTMMFKILQTRRG